MQRIRSIARTRPGLEITSKTRQSHSDQGLQNSSVQVLSQAEAQRPCNVLSRQPFTQAAEVLCGLELPSPSAPQEAHPSMHASCAPKGMLPAVEIAASRRSSRQQLEYKLKQLSKRGGSGRRLT